MFMSTSGRICTASLWLEAALLVVSRLCHVVAVATNFFWCARTPKSPTGPTMYRATSGMHPICRYRCRRAVPPAMIDLALSQVQSWSAGKGCAITLGEIARMITSATSGDNLKTSNAARVVSLNLLTLIRYLASAHAKDTHASSSHHPTPDTEDPPCLRTSLLRNWNRWPHAALPRFVPTKPAFSSIAGLFNDHYYVLPCLPPLPVRSDVEVGFFF